MGEKTIYIRDTGATVSEILEMIANGDSYGQILQAKPELNIADIMAAARTARDLIELLIEPSGTIRVRSAVRVTATKGAIRTVDEVRQHHPRAFEKWTPNEEKEVSERFEKGQSVTDIASARARLSAAALP